MTLERGQNIFIADPETAGDGKCRGCGGNSLVYHGPCRVVLGGKEGVPQSVGHHGLYRCMECDSWRTGTLEEGK